MMVSMLVVLTAVSMVSQWVVMKAFAMADMLVDLMVGRWEKMMVSWTVAERVC